jgi:hypothetical protein
LAGASIFTGSEDIARWYAEKLGDESSREIYYNKKRLGEIDSSGDILDANLKKFSESQALVLEKNHEPSFLGRQRLIQ